MPIVELVYPLKLLIIKGLHIVQGYEIIYLNKECHISTNAIYAFNYVKSAQRQKEVKKRIYTVCSNYLSDYSILAEMGFIQTFTNAFAGRADFKVLMKMSQEEVVY